MYALSVICHSEEGRSPDVGISRFEVILYVSLPRRLPHQSADWFAMTCVRGGAVESLGALRFALHQGLWTGALPHRGEAGFM